MDFTFTYKGYSDFLGVCKGYGEFHLFENAFKVRKGFLLRHDIDFDLGIAKKLLDVELEADVRSTNYILVSNPAYNILTKENRKILLWMVENNFEVGLHFDPTVYEYSSFDEVEKRFLYEKSLLENVCDHAVHSVSLHCPSIHGEFLEFKDVVNAYDKRIFKDDTYLSDSRMGFRGKDPYEFVKRASENLLQVLFHPIHFSGGGSGYKTIFKDLATDRVSALDSLVRPFNSKFVEELGDKKIIHLLGSE